MSEHKIEVTGNGISDRIHIELSGIASAGFWIGVGIVLAAKIIAEAL